VRAGRGPDGRHTTQPNRPRFTQGDAAVRSFSPTHRARPGTLALPTLALTLLLLAPPPAGAQPPGGINPKLNLKEPVPYRVYQRDRDGRADIALVVDEAEGGKDTKVVSATVFNPDNAGMPNPRLEDGKLVGVAAGGPYSVAVMVSVGDPARFQQVTVANVFVGDLWVLAGQSNMEGVGDLIDVAPPNPMVNALGMNGKWARAAEPLHWLVDSPDPVHSGDAEGREKRSAEQHKSRTKGAGLGLPFATAMVAATNVPVGLVTAAHGGTSMGQWDPAKKDEGGKSLYGSMLRQVKLAGGKVKGVLWYQGESDAMNPEAAKGYGKPFADFIAAVRSDFDQPELPFYYVQIGRFIRGGDPKDWNAVQNDQRRLAERVPNTAVVSVIDLELDDGIHVGTQGLKRAGQRLARVALRELFGQVGATSPTLDRVNKGAGNSLVVKLKGVNLGPDRNPGAVAVGGLGGMGGGMGGMAMGPGGMGGGGRGVGMRGPGDAAVVGLKPLRHIAGFSVRKEDGSEIPLIFDAAVGNARDTVSLRLNGAVPSKAFLWYGYGFDPYCNLTDALDMAVPVFGPVPLDELK